MRTKSPSVPKAFDPYTQREVDLILSLVPNKVNTTNLAKALGRSFDAIAMIYVWAYSGRMLKDALAGMKDTQDNVVTKIAKAKKKLGIYIGHEPA